MEQLQSCLYAGSVVHRRLRPVKHRLVYRVFWLLVDLDELPVLAGRFRWLGIDRPGLISFRQSDHGAGEPTGLAAWVRAHLTDAGMAEAAAGPIRLLTMPRVLGGEFNPLSAYFCHCADGTLGAILYEVNNTFGDRHGYLVPAGASEDGLHRASVGKDFHVSPFIGMDCVYHFRTSPPGEKVALGIHQTDQRGADILHAALAARRIPLTDGALFRAWVRHPLLSLKVLGGIHWEALRLWRKGAPIHRRQAPPPRQVTVAGAPQPSQTTRAAP